MANVSWYEAAAYAAWLGASVPTEAQWEYAARAGQARDIYGWGNGAPMIGGGPAANVADEATRRDHPEWTIFNGYNDGHAYTAPVGLFPANRDGVHDMSGNVWEWVADWFDAGYYRGSPDRDPAGPASGAGRVVRGGSWADFSRGLRLSYRSLAGPAVRGVDVGARCARDLS